MIGDYVKKTWQTGDVITKEHLNNNEDKTEELDLQLGGHITAYESFLEYRDFMLARDMQRII